MRKLVFSTAIAMGTVLGIVLSLGTSSEARPQQGLTGNRIAQSSGDVLTPSLGGVGSRPDYVGIVSAFDGQAVDIRLSNNETRTFTLPDNIGGNPPNFQVGQTIAFDATKSDEIKGFEIPTVERQFEGQVSSVGSDQISVITSAGETQDVPVSPELVSMLNLQNGSEVKVTRFRDFPEAAGVCVIKRAAVIPPLPPELPVRPPLPPAPPRFDPLPALW